jgi:hypothetical protein
MRSVCSFMSMRNRLCTLATRTEDIVRVIQRSVGADVRLDALEDLETAAEIQSVLAEDVVDGQPTRIVCRHRVVADAQVLISKIAGGFGHLAKNVRPVGEIGVDVEHAFEVLFLDELRQCERLCLIDFVITFAQFRAMYDNRRPR